MSMKKMDINDLKPGMIFSHAVYITPTNMLVGAQMPVKSKDIDRLKRWGIKETHESTAKMIPPGRPNHMAPMVMGK